MHRSAVWSLSFSPDGVDLYSGDIAGEVHCRDAVSGAWRHELKAHQRAVLDIRFDAGGREVVTASRDGSICIWSRASGSLLRTLRHHAGGVFAVAPAGTRLFSASYDRSIRVTPSGKSLAGHTDAVTDLAIVGDRLVSGSRDLTVKIWALDTGTQITTRRAHTHWVTKVRPAGSAAFVTTSEDGTLAMWDIEGEAPRWRHAVNRYQTPVWGLDVSLDGRIAVTGDATGVPRLWDLETGAEQRSLASARLAHRACALSPDGRRVAVADDEGTISVFDVATGERIWRTDGGGRGILSLVVSEDRRTIVCGHADGSIQALRPDGSKAPAFAGHQRFVYQMRPLTLRRFASAAFDGVLTVWDLATGVAETRCEHGGEIFALAPWNHGTRAATAGGREARLWDLNSGAMIASLPIGGAGAHSLVAASPDGRTVASTDERGALDVWSMPANSVEPRHVGAMQLELETDTLSALAVTPDGDTVVAATAGGTIRIIDLPERRVRTRLPCHEDWIRDLRITADGRYLLAVCQDLAFKVLELATGNEVEVGLAATRVAAIALLRDGTVVAVDLDGAAHFTALG